MMSSLICSFEQKYPEVVKHMSECSHHYDGDSLNPWHLEGDVWTHTMMVCKIAELNEYKRSVQYATLLHDIGKIVAREVDDETHRTKFFGHEGISFYKAVNIIDSLDGSLSVEEKEVILKIIAMHGVLYSMDLNRPNHLERYDAMFKDTTEWLDMIAMRKCDYEGRYTTIKTEENYPLPKFTKRDTANKIATLTVLIGPPRSGKSTWTKNNRKEEVVVSRDEVLMRYGKDKFGLDTYTEIWNALNDQDHQEIDSRHWNKFESAVKESKNIILDRTNMSKKSRKKWLQHSHVKRKYRTKAVLFATGFEEIMSRSISDKGKQIPENVIIKMMKSLSFPDYHEFDEVQIVF